MKPLSRRARAVLLACAAVALPVVASHAVLLFRLPAAPDVLFLFLPDATFLREQLLRLQVPLWNPLLLAGHPFLAELQTQVLYPPSLLFLLGPPARMVGPFLLAHLVWLAVGTWRLARYSGASRRAALLAGLAAGLSPLAVEHYAHPNMLCGLSWVPWVWGSSRLLARRGSSRGVVLLGVQVACSVLAGSPELTLAALAGLAWNLRRRLGRAAGAVALGAGLSASTWIPFLELFAHSERGSGIGAGEAAAFSLAPGEVVDLALPFVRFVADRSGAQGFQSVLFVGASILLLAAWGLRRRPWLGALCGVCVLLALGEAGHLFTWLRAVPCVSFFRFPFKFLSPLPVLLALLVASGFSAWERAVRSSWRRPALLLAGGSVLGAVVLGVSGAGAGWTVSVAWVGLSGAVLLGARGLPSVPRGWAVAALLVLECAVFQQGVGTLWSQSRSAPCVPSPAFHPEGRVAYDITWNEVKLANHEAACAIGIPNANMLAGFAALEGFVVPAPAYVKRLVRQEPVKAAAHLGASVVVIDDESKRAEYGGQELFRSGRYIALGLEHRGRALLQSGPEQLELEPEVDTPERLVFNLPRAGERLLIRDAWFPGWEAEADGAPVPVLEDEGLRAIALRGSEHRVELRYRPGSFRLGLGVSLLSLVALALLSAVCSFPALSKWLTRRWLDGE